MGESFGRWELGADAEILPHVTSANIACGAHAGDPAVMRRTLRLAKQHGVACGAHPGFADLAGFGRREIPITASEAIDLVVFSQRGPEGPRVTEIVAVEDLAGSPSAGAFTVTELFTRTGPGASLAWTGDVPVRLGAAFTATGEDLLGLLAEGAGR